MTSTARRTGLTLASLFAGLLLYAAGFSAWATTVRVHYDTGFGNRIAIRGSKAPLSWSSGASATWTSGNVWVYSWPDAAGDLEIKPLLNDVKWSTGANYRVRAGATVDIYPFFGPAAGSRHNINNFHSPQLGNSRTLRIYLPPSYNENSLKRYPVLYMHDGQNLFDAATAFGGVEWRVDETIDSLVGGGRMDEVIVVGIDNTADRIAEYTMCCDSQHGGGKLDLYSAFVRDTVKPYIDQHLRTLPGKDNTALMGSSLGGLASFYIARNHPAVFAKEASLSSSFWWNDRYMVKTVAASTAKAPVRIYLDAGTQNDGLADTTAMRDALIADGYVQGADLYYYVAQGASHNEASWAARLDRPLTYLFPWQSTVY
ncbi:MAG TPA: alpha/beta hydrolase-fold protein [Paucimonas sp.]|nr:alpha/beta hydrolase-fold protein [Paucimonas sp.]